jgi:RimJ/RimL family protein N-acetyltransferase
MSTLSTLAGTTPTPAPQPKPVREPIRGLREGEWVDVLPYDARFDPMSRHFLWWLWDKLHTSGLLALYYPHDTEASFPEMVKMFSGGTNVILVVVKNEKGEIQDLLGFATWGPMQLGLAQVGCCGFIFLPDYWQARATSEAATRIMRMWFDESKLDLLVGIIAKDNVLAQRFMSRIGWQLSGSLPNAHLYSGKPSDATIWYMTREAFESKEKQ